MDKLERFFKESVMAARVTLATQVVVHRDLVSPRSLDALGTSGTYVTGASVCDLEVGGQVVARGRLVVRGGKRFFQVREMAGGDS